MTAHLKHIILWLVVVLAFPCLSNAQRLALLSMEGWGGEKFDYLTPSVVYTNDGGVIINLETMSVTGNINSTCFNNGDRSVFRKYNANGTLEWEKCYTNSHDSMFMYLFLQSNGDRVLGGAGISPSNRYLYIRREDSMGNILGSRIYGGSRDEFLRDLAATDDGGYIMVGETYSDDGDVGYHYGGSGSYFFSDIWVLKVDGNGDKLWSRVIGGSSDDFVSAVMAAPGGGCYIIGSTSSDDYDCTGLHGPPSKISDIYIARLAGNGDMLWHRCLGGNDGDAGYDLCSDGKGGILAAGSTYSHDGDVSRHIGGLNFWLINLDSNGNVLWDNCYGGNYVTPYTVCRATDGSIWMGGKSPQSGGQVDAHYGGDDGWVIRTDSMGNFLGGRVLGASRDDGVTVLYPLSDGSVMAGGYYSAGDPTGENLPVTFYGQRDIFLSRLAPWTTGVTSLGMADRGVQVYPNPARDGVTVRLSEPGVVRICDITGREVYFFESDEGGHHVDVSRWSKGLYHVQVQMAGGHRASERLIVY